uniref:Kinesin motor domain-containing protein n=1 Tax=Trichobilharzia regenti TaxID=157069 RepID=A0AA85JMG7_TRIRE|nr:unnamed protein product [Trichobilharzia regenti]
MPIAVYLRVKPSAEVSLKKFLHFGDNQSVVQIENDLLGTPLCTINNQLQTVDYKFEKIFYNASQEEIYQITASRLIVDALAGINGTIMCYGQTGAGKTYTMSGLSQLYNDRGIIPRGIAYLFEEIKNRSTLSITVKLSYFEIYNEQIIDLLNDISTNKTVRKQSPDLLQIAESNDQVYIKGLKCITVNNLEEALTALFEGELNRTTASHTLNRSSSRSHVILTVYLEIVDPMDSSDRYTRYSKIHYVDLAGSERLKGVQTTDKLFKEATYINRSLTFLEQTILALSDQTRDYIPYRQSKLTHYLKNSIGGRCQTILIANVWNKYEYLNETLSTLRFASRAMSIPCKPVVNQFRDPMAIIKNLENSNNGLLRELLMYDTLNNRGQINYEPLTEKQKHKLRNSVVKYLNNEVKDLEIVNLYQLRETFEVFKQINKSLQTQLDEAKEQLSRQSDYTGSRSPTTVAVSTISSGSRSGGTGGGGGSGTGPASKLPSSNSNISGSKRQTNITLNNEPITGKSVQNVNFKEKSLVVNQVGELDPASGRGFLPPIDQSSIGDKTTSNLTLMTDGAFLQAKRREKKQSVANIKLGSITNTTTINEPMDTEVSNLSGPPNKYDAFEEFKREPGSELFNIYQGNKSLLKEKHEEGLKIAQDINHIKSQMTELQEQVNKLKTERELQGLIQTVENQSIITEEEYNLLQQIQALKENYKAKYPEWLNIKETIQYCKDMLDQCQIRLLQEFENWYQQCFNESVNQCDLEVGIPKKTDPSNSNTITNNNNNNNSNSMKKALIDINFNEKEKPCISTQNSEKDYLDEFQQIQENNLSDRKGLLSYERAKEMVAYKQIYQRKEQSPAQKFYRSYKFRSVLQPTTTRFINESILKQGKYCNAILTS